MSVSTARNCPDCATELQPIVIIDRSRYTEFISCDSQLAYTSPDEKPGFWTRSIPSQGTVNGFACPECGRILLYAQPNASD